MEEDGKRLALSQAQEQTSSSNIVLLEESSFEHLSSKFPSAKAEVSNNAEEERV